jgi:hypothetical protein
LGEDASWVHTKSLYLGNAGISTAVVTVGGVDTTVNIVSRGVELIFTKVTPSLWSSTIIIVLLIDSWPF